MARNLSGTPEVQAQQQADKNEDQPNIGQEEDPVRSAHVPSGYNSLINNMMSTRRVGAPPVIAAPVHELLQLLTKYVFAHDRLNYGRMIPMYLTEMASLKTSDPEIYAEFLQGNVDCEYSL